MSDKQPETVEEDSGVDEVPPDVIQTERMMWLTERATSLENEKEEVKRVIQEMQTKMTLQENAIKEVVERLRMTELAITQIVEHVRCQEVFNGSVRTSFNALENRVQKHQDNFHEVV